MLHLASDRLHLPQRERRARGIIRQRRHVAQKFERNRMAQKVRRPPLSTTPYFLSPVRHNLNLIFPVTPNQGRRKPNPDRQKLNRRPGPFILKLNRARENRTRFGALTLIQVFGPLPPGGGANLTT